MARLKETQYKIQWTSPGPLAPMLFSVTMQLYGEESAPCTFSPYVKQFFFESSPPRCMWRRSLGENTGWGRGVLTSWRDPPSRDHRIPPYSSRHIPSSYGPWGPRGAWVPPDQRGNATPQVSAFAVETTEPEAWSSSPKDLGPLTIILDPPLEVSYV